MWFSRRTVVKGLAGAVAIPAAAVAAALAPTPQETLGPFFPVRTPAEHGFDLTRADGAYRIRTIKPGPYPDPAGGMRTPHIHFEGHRG